MGLFGKLSNIFRNKDAQDFIDNLEDTLLESGLSPKLCSQAVQELNKKAITSNDVQKHINALIEILSPWTSEFSLPQNPNPDIPQLCFFVGVNGVGKTTSIAKFAFNLIYKKDIEKNKITLAAGDTFRAAAASQLEKHAQKLGTDFIRQKDGADPAAVIFDAISHAKSLQHNFVLADTAGRMNTRKDLVSQLEKIYRITLRAIPQENIITFMVLDGNNGLTSLNQVKDFLEATPLNACIFTKYDGSTRGGIIISIFKELGVPCAYLGTGETYSDLQIFNKEKFFNDFLLSE